MRRWLLVVAVVLGSSGMVGLMRAEADDRSAAEQALAGLESDAHSKQLCADPIAKARFALERAHRMRVAGDDKHARLAEALAQAWVGVAQELVRADAIETRAQAAAAVAGDAGTQVEHERATLEQQLAENGRLQAELAKAENRDGGT